VSELLPQVVESQRSCIEPVLGTSAQRDGSIPDVRQNVIGVNFEPGRTKALPFMTKQAKKDDCDYAVDHYDLVASEMAITDAKVQHASFDGEGPYLVGWSPSNARGVPDKLVLVIDMSTDNSQALIDQKFLFWKKQIVEDPSRWRNGFSAESIRAAIRIFADQYGQSMIDAIKLIGDNKR
jgi:hypothetical protein